MLYLIVPETILHMRCFNKVCFQGPAQELVDGLKTCLISTLKCYYDVSIQLI